LPRDDWRRRADFDAAKGAIMDSGKMHELLHGYLREMTWTAGVSKDDIVAHLADRDDALRTLVEEYLAEGTYYAVYEVMDLMPAQAWQDAQGDVWRGGEMQYVEDVPSNFMAGPVGGDESDVYQEGEPAPQTPGFGRLAGAGDAGAAAGSCAENPAKAGNAGAAGSGGGKSGVKAAPQAGEPGDGAGQRYDPQSQHAGVWPVSGPPIPDPNAVPQPMASFGQGERGAAGFADHGDSELIAIPPEDVSGAGEQGGAAG
jgi:hypothetical protein